MTSSSAASMPRKVKSRVRQSLIDRRWKRRASTFISLARLTCMMRFLRGVQHLVEILGAAR